MRYKEYSASHHLDRRIGIFGETHIYTPDESKLVSEIVQRFDIVASEGSGKKDYLFWVGILYIPLAFAMILGTDRRSPDTVHNIAKRSGKEIFHLEKDTRHLFSFTQKIAMALGGLVSMPFAPFEYMNYKKNGDPYAIGTKAYEKRIAEEKSGKKNLLQRLTDYGFASNLKERDKLMAEKSFDIFQESAKNLLIVCGELHLDGIVENLHNKLELKEVNSFP